MDAPGAGRRLVATVALVLATRVLGLSLVLPGFAAFGATFTNDLAVVGFAFGAYGVSMALLQIPFGILSDRIGRRPAILVGLAVSALGSFLAAGAPSMGVLILARLLQGAGAVNGVALALLGERTDPGRRTTALAFAGAAIGIGFTAGLVAGAVLSPFLSVRGLFVANGVLGLGVLGLAAAALPSGVGEGRAARAADLARALGHAGVVALSLAAFATNLALHGVLFRFVPAAERYGPPGSGPLALGGVVVLGGVVMFLGARQADRGKAARVGRAASLALAGGAAAVALAPGFIPLLAAGVLFFAGQSVLAALLPSLAQREAPEGARGAAQSALQVAGYGGIVAGPTLAGALASEPLVLAALLAAPGLLASAVFARRYA